MNAKDIYTQWKHQPNLDEALKIELDTLSEQDIIERFSVPLKFGTGGLRGPMGVGISRLNVHTIMQAAAGFGMYLKTLYASGTVVISYDNRQDSRRFALKSAAVLSAFGFDVKVFDTLRPTPMLSYAVRYFKAVGGIMITASHNPKEDNGFKAYNASGAQLNLEEAQAVIDHIATIKNIFDIEEDPKENISFIEEAFDDVYLKDITSIERHHHPKTIKIVYSPLHGTGGTVIPKLLTSFGYDLYEVKEEMVPDPQFTHTKTSNPEQKDAYINAITLAKAIDADLVLITDPDADRLGVAAKHEGDYTLLNGNQTAAIELQYILNETKALPKDGIVYTTIVTSDLIKRMAEASNIQVIETLTGFKFIGEQAELNDAPYIFGCEESYGSLISDKVRDKDAVQACFMLAEIANHLAMKNQTLIDYLTTIYQTYGYHLEHTDSVFFKGVEGPSKMASILNSIRQSPLSFQGFELLEWRDYASQKGYKNNETFDITLPKSNVIEYRFDSFWVILRPSGTEPKLKIYYGIKENDEQSAKDVLSYIQKEMQKRLSL